MNAVEPVAELCERRPRVGVVRDVDQQDRDDEDDGRDQQVELTGKGYRRFIFFHDRFLDSFFPRPLRNPSFTDKSETNPGLILRRFVRILWSFLGQST